MLIPPAPVNDRGLRSERTFNLALLFVRWYTVFALPTSHPRTGSRDAIRPLRALQPEGLAHLARSHGLRQPVLAPVGAAGSGIAADHTAGAGGGNQPDRHLRLLFRGRERGGA